MTHPPFPPPDWRAGEPPPPARGDGITDDTAALGGRRSQHAAAHPRNGFGITALCLALGGLVFGLVPFTGFVAAILGALALLFGLLGLGRVRKGVASNKVMSLAGALLGAAALALGIWGMVIVFGAFDDLSDTLQGPTVAPVSPAVPTVPVGPGDPATAAPAAGDSGPAVVAFGGTQKWETGVEVTVGPPASYRPSSTAAGADGARAVSFEVTVKNGGSAPLDLSSLMIQASHNGQPTAQIYDSAKKMMGAPSTSVLPGKTAKFTVAFPVDAQPGEMQLEVTPGYTGDRAYFTGTV